MRLYNVYKKMDIETLEEIAVRKDYKIEVNKIGMGIIAFATSVILFCIALKSPLPIPKVSPSINPAIFRFKVVDGALEIYARALEAPVVLLLFKVT